MPRKKPKISRKNKSYPLENSPLYRLKSKHVLARYLNITVKDFELLKDDSQYRCRPIKDGKGKLRNVSEPQGSLYAVHTRLASFLARITPPDYLHSGTKGRSCVTNAKIHIGNHPVLKIDFKNFYPSISKKAVFWFFYNKMEVDRALAGLLAAICTYKNQIPVGSPLSQLLAAFSCGGVFNRMSKFALSQKCRMTVYVDDVVFSGHRVDQAFRRKIEKMIDESGFLRNAAKTKLYLSSEPKVITGVVVRGEAVLVPNKLHKKIYDLRSGLRNNCGIVRESSLRGLLSACGQVEPKFKEYLK